MCVEERGEMGVTTMFKGRKDAGGAFCHMRPNGGWPFYSVSVSFTQAS